MDMNMNMNLHTPADPDGRMAVPGHEEEEKETGKDLTDLKQAVTHTHLGPDGKTFIHTHVGPDGKTFTHTHTAGESAHGHYHSPEEKKKQINRIAKTIGHLQHVKGLIENDEDCSQVLMQLAAVEAALHSLGKEIINEHMTHCITHAIENGDLKAVEDFQKAISKYM